MLFRFSSVYLFCVHTIKRSRERKEHSQRAREEEKNQVQLIKLK